MGARPSSRPGRARPHQPRKVVFGARCARLRQLLVLLLLFAASLLFVAPNVVAAAPSVPSAPASKAGACAGAVTDSAGFAAALRDPRVSRVLLAAGAAIALDPADFPRAKLLKIARPVNVSACSNADGDAAAAAGAPAVLDLGSDLALRVVVADGGRLAFQGPGLKIAGAPPVMRHPSWPDYNPLLLGLVDVEGAGAVALDGVTVATRSPANVSLLLERYPPSLRPDYSVVGPGGAALFVPSWELRRGAYEDAAAEGGAGAEALSVGEGRRRRRLRMRRRRRSRSRSRSSFAAGGRHRGRGRDPAGRHARRRRAAAAPHRAPRELPLAADGEQREGEREGM